MENDKKHLYNLDELTDYKVAEGYSDIRSWDVKDRDNRVIGKVKSLLVSKEAEKVVYLDVEVDKTIIDAKYDPYSNPANPEVREFINKDGENHIIIPVGLVEINSENNHVYTDSVDHRTFAETKRYAPGTNIDRDYEIAVLDSYDRKTIHDDIRLSNDEIRTVVRQELNDLDPENFKSIQLSQESRIRKIVRDEIYAKTSKSRKHVEAKYDMDDIDEQEPLSQKRARLNRDDFDRTDESLDFDHDNDGNPNITDPDYYKKKARDIKTADYDHDNDGNPNITDPDYYEKKGREISTADYDHDNDGNPNITDPDYYKSRNRRSDKYYEKDGRHFYERREFDDRLFNERRDD